jgi:DNA polymerase (family 10)
MRRLLDLPVVTSSEALVLARQLDVLTHLDLEYALEAGRIRTVLGNEAEHRLATAARTLAVEIPTMVLGRAWDLLESLLTSMAGVSPPLPAFEPAGDVRRSEPLVSTIILVGASDDPTRTLDTVSRLPVVDTVLHRGARRCILSCREAEIDVRVAVPGEHGTALFEATGSRSHVVAVRRRQTVALPSADEAAVYERRGLQYVAPELRHDTGEIEAAAGRRLPSLVTRRHIRGDLHMHTRYSDGRDSIFAMVQECLALGHEYLAITDHSQSAAASRTLSVGDIARQKDDIARVREQFPRIQILHGVEVDILPDGRLDFSDDVLEQFDIVLASLHERVGHDARRLTDRCLAALRHPLVTIFTHPQNRIPGQRAGYPLDFEVVYAVAAETGTALEVDGSPGHLDLDGEHARAAVLAGVTLAIDSDCHRATSLERQMRLGVGTARRGWVEPANVLNTRSIEEVRAFIARKRALRR